MQGENAGRSTINVSDYGQVITSGWGDEPSKDIQEWKTMKHHRKY